MKILVVEDSGTMRRVIMNTLKSIGYDDFAQAGDGEEALACLEEDADIGLILCDWNMPNMDGLEFLLKLRESNTEIPFVMITSEGEMKSVESPWFTSMW